MTRLSIKKILSLLAGFFAAGVLLVGARVVLAQVSVDLPGNFAGFSSQDIKQTIENIVQIVLGFIGIIFIVLLIYAGWLWMTSGGSADKIDRAKKIIISSVIGLLLTLSAYAISIFIISSLQQAVGPGGSSGPPGCLPPGCTPIPLCDYPGPSTVKICSISGTPNRGSVVTVKGYNFHAYAAGISEVRFEAGATSAVAELVSCGGDPSRVWRDQSIRVIVPETISNGLYMVVVKNDTSAECSGTDCKTANVSDPSGRPELFCLNPDFGPSGTGVIAEGENFGSQAGSSGVYMTGTSGPFDITSANVTSWAADAINFNVPVTAISGDVFVRDQNSLDSNTADFRVTCNVRDDCASGCCSNNACHDATICAGSGPLITAITHGDGEEGNYVTISGRGFGATQGTLHFQAPNGVDFQNSFPAVCGANWTDTQIIMEVPNLSSSNPRNSPPLAQVWITTAVTATSPVPLDSNTETFDVNDTVRPGLCRVNPVSGYFGDNFTLTGNNFSSLQPRDIYFGTPPTSVSADNPGFPINTSATGKVPNILPNRTVVSVSVGAEASNPLDFEVLSGITGNPEITDIDPPNGPTGQYVTIIGRHFGILVGTVHFKNRSTGVETLADVQFPPVCSTDFWRDDHIVVKVPLGIPLADYNLVVTRTDSVRSQPSAEVFTKNSGTPTPGLCSLNPVKGAAGTNVLFQGESFGPAAGSYDALFFDNQSAVRPGPPNSFAWNNQQVVNAQVPSAATTGLAQVKSSSGALSNGLPFDVGSCQTNSQCPLGNSCCDSVCRPGNSCNATNSQENNWNFTAGQYPFDIVNMPACPQSPTPYPFEQRGTYSVTDQETNAPVDSVIAARFTRDLDFNTITVSTVRIFECNYGDGFLGSSSCATEITTTNGSLSSFGPDGWRWTPTIDFNPGTWYEVRLDDPLGPGSRIYALDGSNYLGSAFLGVGDPERFRWHFHTRPSSQDVCVPTNVMLNPSSMTVGVGAQKSMSAQPVSDQCYLCGGNYNYQWSIAQPAPPYASFVPPNPNVNQTSILGQRITPSPVPVTATILNGPTGPISSVPPADLTVVYTRPRVVGVSPNNQCQAACLNVTPSATFNLNMVDTFGVTETDIFRCQDNRCLRNQLTLVSSTMTIGPSGVGSNPSDKFTITPNGNLNPDTWYRVLVRGASKDASQSQTMDPAYLNFDELVAGTNDAFSWIFKTGTSTCNPDVIRVLPDTANIDVIGNQQAYHGDALVTQTSCSPFSVDPNDYSWNWQSSIPSVATVSNSVAPQQTATAVSPGATLIQARLDIDDDGSYVVPPDLYDDASLTVSDNRSQFNLIGVSPDCPPPGVNPNGTPDPTCDQCRNVLVSATFDYSVDKNSIDASVDTSPPGALAYYTFDNGTANDTINAENNAVLFGNTAPTGPNTAITKLGRAMFFDGSGDFIEVQDGAWWWNPKGAGNLNLHLGTWEAWVKPTAINQSYHRILYKEKCQNVSADDCAISAYEFSINQDIGGGPGFQADIQIGPDLITDRIAITGGTAVVNEWHYLVATYDGEFFRLYVNGDQVASTPVSGELIDNTGALGIGSQPSNTSSWTFNGVIDNVRIYNRALSAGDIKQVYDNMLLPATSPNFYVEDLSSVPNKKINGSIKVNNYSDSLTGEPRGRMEFYPDMTEYRAPVYACNLPGRDRSLTEFLWECSGPTVTGGNGAEYEKIAFYLPDQSLPNLIPVRRYFAFPPWEDHKFSANPAAEDNDTNDDGDVDDRTDYRLEEPFGVGVPIWKAYGSQELGTVPIYRCWNQSITDTHYTQDSNCDNLPGYVKIRVEFYAFKEPTYRTESFGPLNNYRVVANEAGSAPLLSSQGVPYATRSEWRYTTTQDVCSLSFVDIAPNPAVFTDVQSQCLAANAVACLDTAPKGFVATGYSANGEPLGGIDYKWRETNDKGGTYSSTYMSFDQPVTNGNQGEAWHKGLIGRDYSNVEASGTIAGVDLGKVSATGLMDFSFCANPWIGDEVGLNAYYHDATYDFKLSYCRDGADPQDQASLLPSLPAPHIIRDSGSGASGSTAGDLLKEHIFVIGGSGSVGPPLGNTPPRFINDPQADGAIATSSPYRIGDLVYFVLKAQDDDGDGYQMAMTGNDADVLPASASFNPRTGVFLWTVDALPATDSASDADSTNDYVLTFSLNPTGSNQRSVILNVSGTTPPPAISRPTVRFVSPLAGTERVINYGDQLTFDARVDSMGAGAAAIKAFVWDFQDSGLTSYTDTSYPDYQARHSFIQPGSHQVTFRVQNDLLVWSAPTTVNVTVNARGAMLIEAQKPVHGLAAVWDSVRRWLTLSVVGQSVSPPIGLTAQSTGQTPAIELHWQNAVGYNGINIYRAVTLANGTSSETPLVTGLPGFQIDYTDTTVTVGTNYNYRVCGQIAGVEGCSQVQVTARNADYDIIVVRVYKNLDLLPVENWYQRFAPNPVGNRQRITVDGYPAIKDGTSVYVGIANCVNAGTGTCGNGIYGNILLLSYNQGANKSTTDIFDQLMDNLRVNDQLTTDDTGNIGVSCSGDDSIICDPGYDGICAEAKAGICLAAKATLRRDFRRVVDLHTMVSSLETYADTNTYCNDGSNTKACSTDLDCPLGNICTGAYPALTSGSYLGGLSTSQWPSWQQTLGKELGATLPLDPINRFGANFYTPSEVSCDEFPGFDSETCWNNTSLQFKCQRGSSVYIYQNRNGTNFTLYGQLEASGWNWPAADPRVNFSTNAICQDTTAIGGSCGNGVIEGTERCDGGSTYYCDAFLGPANYNSDFKVGCRSDCTDWTNPYAGNPAAAQAACGGACGNGTVNAPYEQCDTTAPAGFNCTSGGSIYCSNTCQISCTAGTPYGGRCGDGAVTLPEVCDDGGSGPPVGYCNSSCTGYDNFCGDGVLTTIREDTLGCVCDSDISFSPLGNSCLRFGPDVNPIAGQACNFSCPSGGNAHQWSCVKNVEECEGIAGLTSYSCPAGGSLSCDSSCNRSCTNVDNSTIPIYEHYYVQGNADDYDYTIYKKADASYSTKGIVFYAHRPDPIACPVPGTVQVYRYKADDPGTDRRLSLQSTAPAGYQDLDIAFCAWPDNAGGDPGLVPVYEFRSAKGAGTADDEYYYGRNVLPRSDISGNDYIRTQATPAFYARLGPLQETCGNSILEGNETCEPGTYQTPDPQDSSAAKQYACGNLGTPNACQTYGGFCGDATSNTPFEECDEGTAKVCSGDPSFSCTNDSVCIAAGKGTCVGNGVLCDNSGGNCNYCSVSCRLSLLPRNFCGDGIRNIGPDGLRDTADDVEACDDGPNNGKSGFCNDSCSGATGAVCGNSIQEGLNGACLGGADVCEACDDGPLNGSWSYTCSSDNTTVCAIDSDCSALGLGTCSGDAAANCNSSCTGDTVAYCGDSIVQRPNAGPDQQPGTVDDVDESCDSGSRNGQPNECNLTCNGLTPSKCGNLVTERGGPDGIIGTADDEQCDFSGSLTVECTDTAVGVPGLRTDSCNNTCQLSSTQCQAYGLKIWSDDVDVVYINQKPSLYQKPGSSCSADPDNINYPDANICSVKTQVAYTSNTTLTDQYTVRPDVTTPNEWEVPGKNVIAVKVWDAGATDHSFQAVYSSRNELKQYVTTSGQQSDWICTNDYQADWYKIDCPTCVPSGGTSWRAASSYTGSPLPEHAACNDSYPNNAGTGAQWIWGPTCSATTVYCRLQFNVLNLPTEAAWNTNYGWVRMRTVGSTVEINPNGTLSGAAWNTNLGWLYFDGTPTDALGNANPLAANPVRLDVNNNLVGSAWGNNYGQVLMNPTCGGDPACGVKRNVTTGALSGYAWSEAAGWVDFGPFSKSTVFLPFK